MPLPKDILRQRLQHEIAACRRKLTHSIVVSDPTFTNFPVEIKVTMRGTPGPIMRDGVLTHKFTHKFTIEITEDYPYHKPIIRWQSQIFHPNIMIPEDGGYVCTKLLDDWDFSSNLLSFFKGIESLLANPNPANPYGTDTCTRAAEYFNKHPYKPPEIVGSSSKAIKIIGASSESESATKEEEKDGEETASTPPPPPPPPPPPSGR